MGPGAHIAFYNSKNYTYGTVAGLDGVVGLDFKVNNAPLNLSVDWQPSFQFESDLVFGETGAVLVSDTLFNCC